MSIEILTDKLQAGEITREEFIAQMAKLTAKPATKKDDHDDAYQFVMEALNAHREPDPRVLVDLFALLVTKVQEQTGYVANTKAFDEFNMRTLENVLETISVLKKNDLLFPTRKRSKNKYTLGDKENLGANAYIVEYLLNCTDEKVVLSEEDF